MYAGLRQNNAARSIPRTTRRGPRMEIAVLSIFGKVEPNLAINSVLGPNQISCPLAPNLAARFGQILGGTINIMSGNPLP